VDSTTFLLLSDISISKVPT